MTIYLADFERPINEKIKKDFFDDPTSTSLTCARGTTVNVGDISKDPGGEEVFEVNRSLFFKVLSRSPLRTAVEIHFKILWSHTFFIITYFYQFSDQNKRKFEYLLRAQF